MRDGIITTITNKNSNRSRIYSSSLMKIIIGNGSITSFIDIIFPVHEFSNPDRACTDIKNIIVEEAE